MTTLTFEEFRDKFLQTLSDAQVVELESLHKIDARAEMEKAHRQLYQEYLETTKPL